MIQGLMSSGPGDEDDETKGDAEPDETEPGASAGVEEAKAGHDSIGD